MDQIKIGKFIAECRKKQKLTQAQLAEQLHITDRAVSKWETGKSLPDSSIMIDLCKILNITVIDLLNGEIVAIDDESKLHQQSLLELVKQKEKSDKRLLRVEIFIVIISIIIVLAASLLCAYTTLEDWIKIVILVTSLILCIIGIVISMRIEQVAGYYECQHCGIRYIPKMRSFIFAMHMGRTRYLKCPKCGVSTRNKKVISKNK